MTRQIDVKAKQYQQDALLSRALLSAAGVLVRTNCPERLRAELYARRAKLLSPEADQLQFRIQDYDGGNLIITKGAIRAPKSSEEDLLDALNLR